ncbi:alanine--glyoxylate aminotransferase 2-like [Drosophila bipectinata]|uniref:alanine--glyoxylate aminotransferase 2-like n=1 Tax=Drosophila bipectinata TaxID=42026 RepID=UPI001C8993D6|nr:alanine--glyoxylate aminotransferase 2-like [Drosophila bipectinata]
MPFANEQLKSVANEQLTKSETIKLRNQHIGQACQLFYRSDPLKIVRGQGQYMFDEEGTRYLDCINNVAHVGHCHPEVVRAGALQMATISTNNRFLHDELVQCARTLASKMPEPLSVCFFVNSGSEANDLALRLARNFTKRQDVITLDHAYHGHLQSVMEVSPYKFNQPGGEKKPDYVHVAPCPDIYGGQFTDKMHPDADMAAMYARPIEEICERQLAKGEGVAAFIAESLQSCGGQILPPAGYFQAVYDAVRSTGGVCIADEVQVGFGRVGSHYWAFETQGVVPDIVCVAKPMGNGHPVGAVVTTPEIAQAFHATGVAYFNTYGGNPVSCAIANAVMRIIDEENLQQKAHVLGEYLIRECNSLKQDFECIGDVRGAGLFVGIELVRDREARTPDKKSAHWVVNRMKQLHHVLVSSDGPNDNVIKLKPPMCFNRENADEFLLAFRECLTTLMQERLTSAAMASATTTTNGVIATAAETLANKTKLFERQDRLIKSV